MSISEYRVFSTAISYYTFGYRFGTRFMFIEPTAFIRAKIIPKMLLQVATETSDILSIHRWIRY